MARIPSASAADTRRSAAAPAQRRTQEERRTATQRKLREAALELLAELGYERLTTTAIARRAGVSKGAQAYHYPTKDDMLVAAFEHLLEGWNTRRHRFVKALEGEATMEQVLRYLWRDVFGRADYVASVELMLAARHHPDLRARLNAVLAPWTDSRDEIFRRILPIDDRSGRLATFLQLNFCVLRGMALYGGLNDDRTLDDRMLKMWLDMASAYVETERRPTRPATNAGDRRPKR